MINRLKSSILIIGFWAFICPINAQTGSSKKEQVNKIKADSNTEKPMENPFKNLDYGNNNNNNTQLQGDNNKEGLFFLEDSTAITSSEYKKETSHTNNSEESTESYVAPKNKKIWFFSEVSTYSKKGLTDTHTLRNVQTEINTEFAQFYKVIAIEKEEIVIINKENGNHLTIIKADKKDDSLKECDSCAPQKFIINTVQTTDKQLVIEIPYDDNPDIVIQLSFKNIVQP